MRGQDLREDRREYEVKPGVLHRTGVSYAIGTSPGIRNEPEVQVVFNSQLDLPLYDPNSHA